MMITKMKSMLVAALFLLTGTAAQAQFEGSVSQYPTKGYEGSTVSFGMAEVAKALETDVATLAKAVSDYIAAETPDPVLFSVIPEGYDETPWTAATEADSHGFWLDANGVPVGYGDNSVWYISPGVEGADNAGDVNADGAIDVADISAVITIMAEGGEDLTGDVNGDGAVDVADISAVITIMAGGVSDDAALTFTMGQMPSVSQGGENYAVTVKLTLNGKSATFQLALNVKEKPVYNVPQPTLIESALNIVGEQEKIVEQYPRGDYSSDEVTVTLPDLAELLGIPDMGVMTDQIESVVYTTWYNDGDVEAGGGMKKDSLTNTPTGEGHGFWYRAVQNADGEEDGEVACAGWGGTDKFYMNNFTYVADDNTMTCLLGQYPGSCKDNETWFANVYVIYGEKAYRIKYTLKLLEKEQGTGMSTYTKLGETSVTVEQEPLSDWAAVQAKPDMEAIAATLGCEVEAIGMTALDDKDNFAGSTANNGGYWFSEAGTVVAYENGAFYIEPMTADDYSVLNVGHKPNTRQVGDELKASIYFTNGNNYYQYNVTLKIVEPQFVEYGFQSVATRAVQIQTRVSPFADAYQCDGFYTISLDEVEELIGTRTPTLYGQNNDSIAAIKGQYSNAYSCDPKPGFWLNKDGYVSTWGSSPVGICWLQNGGGYVDAPEGSYELFQMPNLNSVGDVFKTTLFLVNEETEKMITFNFQVSFVEKLTPVEVVGSENIVLPLTADETQVKFDVTKACEALDITIDDLMNPNNYYLRGLTADGVFSEATNADNGLSFNMEGAYDGYGDIYFILEQDGDDVYINIGCVGDYEDGFSVDGQFCLEVNDQRYIFYVKFVSPELYDAAE